MPGIVGILGLLPPEQARRDLTQMLHCMEHESFYRSGTYVDAQLGLYVGWVCHEGSFSDGMPVFNEIKDRMLIFTGEHFGDFKTSFLRKSGHDFESSNASYLMHLYENDEDCFFQSLNGCFSGIIVDRKKEKIVLFNDRYGMQRIYYHESHEAFLFATEAKSLLRVCSELRVIDPNSLGEYFVCGSVLQYRTLFPKVFILPGGSAWEFRNAQCKKKYYYFKPEIWENQPLLDTNIFYERFRETFLNILPSYFTSNCLIALSLTGGLDTRMILAGKDNSPGSLPCYTFGGVDDSETLDIRLARKVAEACHQTHSVLRLGGDFLSKFAEYAAKTVYVTDGCFGVCGAHEVYLNRLARDIAPIRMTGNYGSEILRGVDTFKSIALCEQLFHPDFRSYVQKAHATFTDTYRGHRLSRSVFKQVPWHLYGSFAAAQSQLTFRTPYLDNTLVGLIYQASASPRPPFEVSTRLIVDSNSELLKIPTDMGIGGEVNIIYSKVSKLLHWLTFKMDYYYNEGLPHWAARFEDQLSRPNLEKYILGKHKYLHYRRWFRKELASYAKAILTDQSTIERPYWNKELEKIITDHIEGHTNNLSKINMVLTVELIHRLLLHN